jgi:hypothetical protein
MHQYSGSLEYLEIFAGYIICILMAVFGFVVAWKLITNQIDISRLLEEKDEPKTIGRGPASMARFQLLVFIFVIAISFFIVVISNVKIRQAKGDKGPDIPEVPSGALLLLGISTSGYAVGKAIQHGTGTRPDDDAQNPPDKKI